MIFCNFSFKITLFTKIMPDFWQEGKAMQNIQIHLYSWGGQLILDDLLNKWVAEGVASNTNDFNAEQTQFLPRPKSAIRKIQSLMSYSIYSVFTSSLRDHFLRLLPRKNVKSQDRVSPSCRT